MQKQNEGPNDRDVRLASPPNAEALVNWMAGIEKLQIFQFPPKGPFVSPREDEPDGSAWIGWDQNKAFPAYKVLAPNGVMEMVPFTPLAQLPPEGYEGPFYIDDFTDMAIKRRWAALSGERKHEIRGLRNLIAVPNQFRETGRADSRGRIDPHVEVNLCGIRRPSFFGQTPWNEPIAEVDGRTHVVEFAVPAEPAEVMHLGSTDPVKLRGWLIEGTGVDDGAGGQRRALAILTAGRSVETTALHHPDDAPAHWDAGTGTWLRNDYRTSARTEGWGVGSWRANHILALNRAGFDVLTLDKRGHGISGGLTDSNTNEQAEDIFRVLDALETGSGLRIARPDGSIATGEELAGELLLGYSSAKDIPVLLGGASQGCMVTCWAMYKNVVGASDFERAVPAAYGPKGYNLIGAILLAPFSGGLGYRPADDALAEASRRLEQNVQTFPTSEVLGSVPLWPALFIGRGLWDYAESLEGSLAAYRAATGPKTLVTVRGPHGENEWGTENIAYMRDCIVRFATNLVAGRPMADLPQPRSLRDAVQLAPAHWPVEARRPTSL